jgi:hypothetical protein
MKGDLSHEEQAVSRAVKEDGGALAAEGASGGSQAGKVESA